MSNDPMNSCGRRHGDVACQCAGRHCPSLTLLRPRKPEAIRVWLILRLVRVVHAARLVTRPRDTRALGQMMDEISGLSNAAGVLRELQQQIAQNAVHAAEVEVRAPT